MNAKRPTDNEPMTEHQQLLVETETVERATVNGVAVDVDPDTATHMGAFEETALDEAAADDSRLAVDPETGLVLDNGEVRS